MYPAQGSGGPAVGTPGPSQGSTVPGENIPQGTQKYSTYPVILEGTGNLSGAAGSPYLPSSLAIGSIGTITIQVALSSSATSDTVSVTLDGTNYFTINGGNKLTPGAWYLATLVAWPADSLNITTGSGSTIAALKILFTQST